MTTMTMPANARSRDSTLAGPIGDDRRLQLSATVCDAAQLPRIHDARHRQAVLQRAFSRDGRAHAGHPGAMRLLLLEGIHDSAVALFATAGYTDLSSFPKALQGGALREQLQGASILGIRSRTHVDADVLSGAGELLAIGCFSVGTDQVDLDAARAQGIPVFNAPFANTRSVAELVVGEIVVLLRQVTSRSAAAHRGEWRKGAEGSREIRGRTLGIVGYGSIGSQLSCLAEALGMRVVYFDIVDKLREGNAERAESLMDLLAVSDVVSLHVPKTPLTSRMVGKHELAAMRKGSCLINTSRGTVVDLEALAESLHSGHLGGAAIDVFPVEPSSSADVLVTPLRGLPNVILTPHIGGSTEEAQEQIGREVAGKLIDFGVRGSTVGAVNFPQLLPPPAMSGCRFAYVYRNIGAVTGRIFEIFARHRADIAAHCCRADDGIGYAVVDVEHAEASRAAILNEMAALDGMIRARVV